MTGPDRGEEAVKLKIEGDSGGRRRAESEVFRARCLIRGVVGVCGALKPIQMNHGLRPWAKI